MTPQTARCGMAKHSPVPGTTICQGPAASLPLPRFPLVASAPGTVAGVRAVCRDPPLLPLYACPPSGAPSPRGMDNFLAMYSGVYDNTAQCRRDPGAILSRKEHRRVELPQLGPHVRFVHPMLYRLSRTITKRLVIWSRWRCCKSRQMATHVDQSGAKPGVFRQRADRPWPGLGFPHSPRPHRSCPSNEHFDISCEGALHPNH